MACEGLGHTSCADNADVHGDILLLRTCSYNEPGLPRQASETTGHSKPFRVFLTIPAKRGTGSVCCRSTRELHLSSFLGSFQIPVDSFSEPLAVIGWPSQP